MLAQAKRPQPKAAPPPAPAKLPLKPATEPAMPMPRLFTGGAALERPSQKKQRKSCPACAAGGAACPKCQAKGAPTLERPPMSSQPRRGSPGGDPAERQADDLGKRIGDDLTGTESVGHGPLPKGVQQVAESHLGVSLEGVHLDAGSGGQRKAKDESALAVTEGKQVAFGEGQLSTSSAEGRALLGHELVHVGQQRADGRAVAQRAEAPPKVPPPADGVVPSSDPIKSNPPTHGTNQLKFENVLLTTDKAFVSYQLEHLVAKDGLAATEAFVKRLQALPSADAGALKTEADRARYGAGDVSGAPGGPGVEEAYSRAADPASVAKIIQTTRQEFDSIKNDAADFLAIFEDRTKLAALAILSSSQSRVESEAARYGIDARSGAPAAAPADHTTQQAREGLHRAAQEVQRARSYATHLAGKSPKTAHDAELALRAQRDYEILRAKREAEYPILASYRDDLSALGAAKPLGAEMKATLQDDIQSKLTNIRETRNNLEDGTLSAWNIPSAVAGTRRSLRVDPGTMSARLVDDELARPHDADENLKTALAAFSIALGVIAAVPTGGASFAAGLAAASVVAGAGNIAIDVKEYLVASAAAGTDFDKARAISQDEPTLLWLALDIVGTALDLGAAVRAFKSVAALRRAAILGDESASAALRTQIGEAKAERALTITKADKEKLIKEASGQAEGVGELSTLKRSGVVKDTYSVDGHEFAVLRDGTIVRCSSVCAPVNLQFGDLLKQKALAEEWKGIQAVKGKAGAEQQAAFVRKLQRLRSVIAKWEGADETSESLAALERAIDAAPKGTPEGDYLRYLRYSKFKGGTRTFTEWVPVSQGGRRGGAAHQALAAELETMYDATPEFGVGGRYADAMVAAEKSPYGKTTLYQIGDVNARGDPIARERRAIDDLRKGMPDAVIVFRPKNGGPDLVDPDHMAAFRARWNLPE